MEPQAVERRGTGARLHNTSGVLVGGVRGAAEQQAKVHTQHARIDGFSRRVGPRVGPSTTRRR